MASVQNDVRARLASPDFDCGKIEIRELRGREGISEPFAFDVEVVVPEDQTFGAAQVLGKQATIVFSLDDADVRSVHGIVSAMRDEADSADGYTRHHLHVVPRLFRMALSATTEVFLGKSVVDIALDKLGRANLSGDDVQVRIQAPPKPAEFRLQYAETDLAFVSRHLERAGIAYSFDHSGAKDVLVLSDNDAPFGNATGPDTIPYVARTQKRGVVDVQIQSAMMASKHTVNDYWSLHPKLNLEGEFKVDVPFAGQVVDFGTGQTSGQEAKALAEIRGLSRQAVANGVEGACNLPYPEAGRTIAIDGHPLLGSDRLLVVWVEHRLTQGARMHEGKDTHEYVNRFRLAATKQAYRPPFVTPWPRIAGYVHAITDAPLPGTQGIDPVLDDQGRYTVRFYFDEADGAKRQQSSARVRMLQPHVGGNYGMHFPLKPGIEVAVSFMEGDPDRPIIVGAVHDGLNQHVVTAANPKINHLQSRSGIHITMKDS
ncbi:MAG TPA: type VI secretion system tip protein TssI/VgrG [Polyangiaceae bacterium]|jgi:type VI secretion system secreted protein VgrG